MIYAILTDWFIQRCLPSLLYQHVDFLQLLSQWGYSRLALPVPLAGESQRSGIACGWVGHSQGFRLPYERGCPSRHRANEDSEAVQSIRTNVHWVIETRMIL